MSAVLIRPLFSSVALALLPNSLVVGEQAEDSLVGRLVHPARPDRLGATRLPSKPCAQFLYPTSRAIPTGTHGGLIGYASALAAEEKPDAVRKVSSVKNARGTAALRA
jgi:hypothetical protein